MTPAPDALGRDLRGDRTLELPVLGIRVAFETNADWIAERIEALFGGWRGLSPEADAGSAPAVRVRILVDPAQAGWEPAVTTARLPDPQRLLVTHPHGVGLADADRGEGVAYVSPRVPPAGGDFDEAILETLTLFLITRFDRHPLHAAGVARGDGAVVLAGPSGVGKSTLAYALFRAGMDVLSDDAVYVQSAPTRVWGTRTRLHLPLNAVERYPELGSARRVRRPGGDEKIAVPLRSPTAPGSAPFARRAGVCLLRRGDGPARAEPIAPHLAIEALAEELEPGFDRFAATAASAVSRVAAGGCWVLHLAPTPAECVPLVEELVASVNQS